MLLLPILAMRGLRRARAFNDCWRSMPAECRSPEVTVGDCGWNFPIPRCGSSTIVRCGIVNAFFRQWIVGIKIENGRIRARQEEVAADLVGELLISTSLRSGISSREPEHPSYTSEPTL